MLKRNYTIYTNYEDNTEEKINISFDGEYEKDRFILFISILQNITHSNCIDIVKGDKALAIHYKMTKEFEIIEYYIEYCASNIDDWDFTIEDLNHFYLSEI